MRRSHATVPGARRLALPLVALLLLSVVAADAAHARKFRMSGSWAMRRGQVFVPLQFGISVGQGTHVSMGDLSYAFGFPHGPVAGAGVVTATGSNPATLRIPRGRFARQYSTRFPCCGAVLIQITTIVSAAGPLASASLAAGGGPGSFTWCPGDPACVAAGGMLSTDPPQGGGTRNGRIVYRSGANQFGGVIQMGLTGRLLLSRPFGTGSPFRVKHSVFGSRDTQHTGGSYSFMRAQIQPSGVATQPTTTPPQGRLILHPGPLVTTMLGLTNTGTGPTLRFPGASTTFTGFPATTGTVFAQQTAGTGGDDFFTAMGSDLRTALGAGNLSLVSGGLALQHNAAGSRSDFGKIRLTLAPPTPSLSSAGAAIAAAAILLATGHALRRRA
jgi:hypothetical protein